LLLAVDQDAGKNPSSAIPHGGGRRLARQDSLLENLDKIRLEKPRLPGQ
jgi:hypothetical protein